MPISCTAVYKMQARKVVRSLAPGGQVDSCWLDIVHSLTLARTYGKRRTRRSKMVEEQAKTLRPHSGESSTPDAGLLATDFEEGVANGYI